MTFLEAQTELLSYANRPIAEPGMQDRAKSCINDAILFSNRSCNFKYAERAASVVYPAGASYVDLGSLCDGKVLGLVTIQRVLGTNFYGQPLELVSFEKLHMKRFNGFRAQTAYDVEISNPQANINNGYDTTNRYDLGIQATDGYVPFLLGKGMGLYPTPSAAVNLMITYNGKLNKLVNDTDTNFFLDDCSDFIITKALQKMFLYLKDRNSAVALNDQIAAEWETLKSWNNNITYSHAISD
jgi:hypothetical protein